MKKSSHKTKKVLLLLQILEYTPNHSKKIMDFSPAILYGVLYSPYFGLNMTYWEWTTGHNAWQHLRESVKNCIFYDNVLTLLDHILICLWYSQRYLFVKASLKPDLQETYKRNKFIYQITFFPQVKYIILNS